MATKNKSPVDPELAAGLRLAVTRLARRMRQQAETPITPSMLSALATVEAKGPLTLRELAESERIQPPTMTVIAARLEDAGLVTREVDRDDRRIARLSISTQGQKLLNKHRTRKEAFLATKLAGLSADQLATIKSAVSIFEKLLEDE